MPSVSIIIVSYNVREYLRACLASIYRHTTGVTFEIIVVDNDSKDDSVTAVRREFPDVRIIENKGNVGFAKANNQGAAVAEGEYLLLLNPDTEFREDAITSLKRCCDGDAHIGLAGPQLLNGDGSLQTSCGRLPVPYQLRYVRPAAAGTAVGFVKGACMFVKKSVYDTIHGFDEAFFMYSEERDFGLRVWQSGAKVVFAENTHVTHFGERSTGGLDFKAHTILYTSRLYFAQKHSGQLFAMLYLMWQFLLNIILLGHTTVAGLLGRYSPEQARLRKQLFTKLIFWFATGGGFSEQHPFNKAKSG